MAEVTFSDELDPEAEEVPFGLDALIDLFGLTEDRAKEALAICEGRTQGCLHANATNESTT